VTPDLKQRLNKHETCIVCRGRADGIGVGWNDDIGWVCRDCGIDRGWEIYRMAQPGIDVVEQRAIKDVLEQLPDDGLNVPAPELEDFVTWIVVAYQEAIRKRVNSTDDPPF
jgi:hypothetical protein